MCCKAYSKEETTGKNTHKDCANASYVHKYGIYTAESPVMEYKLKKLVYISVYDDTN